VSEATDVYRRDVAAAERFARLGEGRYRLDVPEAGITLDLDRLRRESHALWGELTVRCELPGARTYNGILSAGDFNLSSVRARQDRAKHLGERADAPDLDFSTLLEELAQRTIAAEREGVPLVLLRDIPRPAPDEARMVDGLPLLVRHPMIGFGDGGTFKSYLGLYMLGRLEQQGIRCALYDWELDAPDHRDRLERLFGSDMPAVRYHRCQAPLVDLADRIRRDVRDEGLGYVLLDSVAFGCDGPPEESDTVRRYFQALRSIGPVGSLNIAHMSKADGSDMKPFGSVFWYNGARSIWYFKLADGDPAAVTVGLFHRKANTGPKRPPIGWEVRFGDGEGDDGIIRVRSVSVADTPDLAAGLSVRQRMAHLLKQGAMTPEILAEELGAKVDTVNRTARRYRQQFTILPGGSLGLLGRTS